MLDFLFNRNDLSTVTHILEDIPMNLCVIEENNKVIYANSKFRGFFGLPEDLDINSKFGEVIKCASLGETNFECGTTDICRSCGIYNLQKNSLGEMEVDLGFSKAGQMVSKKVKVTSKEYMYNSKSCTLYSIEDISSLRDQRAYEKIFFHDMMNSVQGISGIIDILKEKGLEEEVSSLLKLIRFSTDALIDDITLFRDMKCLEFNELSVTKSVFNVKDVINSVLELFNLGGVLNPKGIKIKATGNDNWFVNTSDHTLIRVLTNLIKNAVEAASSDNKVYLIVDRAKHSIRVKNSQFIPFRIQATLFKKFISTKGGSSRGLGTYSAKLFTERILKGKLNFKSDIFEGTEFTLELPEMLSSNNTPQ